MASKTTNPARGKASGLGNVNRQAADDTRRYNPSRTRLQRLAQRLHALGPVPLFHFLDEVERGEELRSTLETYAELPADLIKAYHGDRFDLLREYHGEKR
jgi:hypothetical protein